jgi:two-component system LytT family response regulator
MPISLLAECDGGQAAVAAVIRHRPDLLIIDIQMPDLDGFGVLDRLSRETAQQLPQVIFVTAYDEYAVRAFEAHALDFLLKPVSRERFGTAVARAREALSTRREVDLKAKLLSWIAHERAPAPATATTLRWRERIEVKNTQRWDYVPATKILWMRADGNYIELYVDGKTHLVRETMQEMDSSLDPSQFLRIGRSTIVNLGAVRAIRPQTSGAPLAELQDGTLLPIQRNLDELQQRLQFARSV